MFSSVSVYRGNSVNAQPNVVQPSGDDGPVQCFDICDLESLQPLQESSSPPLVFVGDALSAQPEVAQPSGGGVLVQLPICDGAAELHTAVTKRPEGLVHPTGSGDDPQSQTTEHSSRGSHGHASPKSADITCAVKAPQKSQCSLRVQPCVDAPVIPIYAAELWAGTCPWMCAMQDLMVPGCRLVPALFSEKIPEIRRYSAAMLPQALDYGPFDASLQHEVSPQKDFVGVTFECAPFTKCGQQRMQNDPRSVQVAQSAEVVISWKPHLVCLENPHEFFENDTIHGLYSKFSADIGMCQLPLFTQTDISAGGSTTRIRSFAVYEDAAMHYGLPPWGLVHSDCAPTPIRAILDPISSLPADLFIAGRYTPHNEPLVQDNGLIQIGLLRCGGCQVGVQPKVLVCWKGSLFRIESVTATPPRGVNPNATL